MSSEVWKIGQQTNAIDLFKKTYEHYDSNVAIKTLTSVCSDMIEAYDETMQDQNDYLQELSRESSELEDMEDDFDKQLDAMLEEIKELDKKEKNNTITDEERKTLEDKRGDFDDLVKESDSKVQNKRQQLSSTEKERLNQFQSIDNIAQNYGEVTVNIGTGFSKVGLDKNDMVERLTVDIRELGAKAVEVGSELLDKVKDSSEINAEIKENFFNIK